jgi:transcription elongation factor Elf1
MGVVDLDDIPPGEYELQPVVWVDCPGCGKGLKSTWFLLEDDTQCNVCGTTIRFRVVSHFDFEFHENGVMAVDQRILRSGNVWVPCQGCDADLDIGWFIHDDDYECGHCGTHHHVEVVFEDIGTPEGEQHELCLLCGETTLVELMDTHHVDYAPEKVVRVCRECHRRIHQEPGYHDDLAPETIPDGSVSDLVSHPG